MDRDRFCVRVAQHGPHYWFDKGNWFCRGWKVETMVKNVKIATDDESCPSQDVQEEKAVKVEGESDLEKWWWDQTRTDIAATIPKAQEYSGHGAAVDLEYLGTVLDAQIGVEGEEDRTSAEKQELAVYFYMQGKMARWHSALMRGVPVSDDTIFDLAVYAKIVQRIRACGGWPNS